MAATECSLPVASVDSGRTAAPSRHSDASVRSRHRFQPKRRQMSPKSLHRRWKHEIQIARAATARAVLPNPSARAEWLFAGIIDRALHRWGHVPALDGGPGEHDLDDSETDTAIPDDGDDRVSLASYAYESICVAIKSLIARFTPVRGL